MSNRSHWAGLPFRPTETSALNTLKWPVIADLRLPFVENAGLERDRIGVVLRLLRKSRS